MASAKVASPAIDATRVRMVHLRYDISSREIGRQTVTLEPGLPTTHSVEAVGANVEAVGAKV